MRVFIELSYDGAPFHGWQRQPHCLTVQEALEMQLERFTGQPVPVMGCGRTDTGVHAAYYVAHADWPEAGSKAKRFKNWEEAAWKLNGMLSSAIAIHRITEVAPTAHARFDAIERGYVYRMHMYKDPFLMGRSARIMRATNFERMQSAVPLLVRKGDFSAFCKSGSDVKTTVCDVRFAQLRSVAHEGQWEFEIRADRFLRNMVRAIVGTLLEIGQGRLEPAELVHIMETGDRSMAGASAPGEGLYLNRVMYPDFDSVSTKHFRIP